jgi:hypothetical protein
VQWIIIVGEVDYYSGCSGRTGLLQWVQWVGLVVEIYLVTICALVTCAPYAHTHTDYEFPPPNSNDRDSLGGCADPFKTRGGRRNRPPGYMRGEVRVPWEQNRVILLRHEGSVATVARLAYDHLAAEPGEIGSAYLSYSPLSTA